MEIKNPISICGHSRVRETLDRVATLSVHPQSFLFSGPRHLGKSLVAREFAEKLIGETATQSNFHPDLLIIGDSSEEDTVSALSVEQIRKAQQFLSRFPEAGKYRVVIIESAERLTLSAENALLKILEEPNDTSIIILITNHPGKLLPTVRSRLFPVSFSLVESEVMRQFFPEANSLPEFFFTLGLPGIISVAVNNSESFEETKNQLKHLFQLSRLSWSERIKLAEQLSGENDNLEQILSVWLIGLARREASTRTITEGIFLESVIETIDRIAERQGNSRLLLEKLFTAV